MLLALLACTPEPDRSELLPSHVAVTVELEDGNFGTVLADLQGPDQPPRIRVAERALVFRDGLPVAEAPIAYDSHAAGPGRGFSVHQEEDAVLLVLPKSQAPVVLVEGVDRVLEVALLPDLDDDATREIFRSIHPIRLGARSARIDGDLSEWDGKSLALDALPEIESGSSDWTGPRDASAAIAARAHHQRISFGLRIRDEHLIQGADRIQVVFGDEVIEIPVGDAGPCEVPERWECAWVEAVEFGTGLEFSMPDERSEPADGTADVLIRYVDVDLGESRTVLATAPSLESVARYGVQRPGPSGSPPKSKTPTSTMP